jgi:hypothetical protein
MTMSVTTNVEEAREADVGDKPAVPARVLLAGVDTLYVSCEATISDAMRARLAEEKQAAQLKARTREVHCPAWLGARVAPQGARGGYAFLLETEDFAVKLLGEHIVNRPGIYLELRSYFLHTHPDGERGACEAALAWVRERLLADQDKAWVRERVSFAVAKVSRADLHIDWQGGYAPTLDGGSRELRAFIRPGKTKWGFYGQGLSPTGYTFGRGHVQARLYNKTLETREKANDAYAALLVARNGETFDPSLDVWRLEFQLRREGVKGFRLYAPPEADDDEAQIEAELAAEELQHIGTLPRFFARVDELFLYLTQHWLRLVVLDEDASVTNRSRLPLHPTWTVLRQAFGGIAHASIRQPLEADARQVVRGARYSGKSRILRRLPLGVVASLEVEDASPTSAALRALQCWVERVAEAEVGRLTQRCAHYEETLGFVPRWVERGMRARWQRLGALEHRVQMLLGIFAAKGVLPLAFKPAVSVGDLLVQHLDDVEREAEAKGGVEAVLAAHFARVYKVSLPGLMAA